MLRVRPFGIASREQTSIIATRTFRLCSLGGRVDGQGLRFCELAVLMRSSMDQYVVKYRVLGQAGRRITSLLILNLKIDSDRLSEASLVLFADPFCLQVFEDSRIG